MRRLSDEQIAEVSDAIIAASGHFDALAAVGEIYRELELEIDRVKPRCDASGACCRFESFRHDLFVTTLELAYFREHHGLAQAANWDGSGCAYQVAGKCITRAGRPFGCRIYFCDKSSDTWQSEMYEAMQNRLRRLHQSAGVPYYYVEWRQGLAAMGVLPTAGRVSLRVVATINGL